jgi:cytochrome c peroxidase
LNLTEQEKKDVVAFMKALTSEPIKVELPALPAGPDGKTPDPRSALKAPAHKTALLVHPPRG